ncbi:hypothetical protein BDY24DRAFT_49876 [Mrakia frigida]|uniref:uncharacterized protein n=1 Tax=Mrakia frigida TaxID=29902 RepID=UPI003FCC24F8
MAFKNQLASARHERSGSVASDLTSLDSSPELRPADFLGGSSGVPPINMAAATILSRSTARPSALGGSSSQRSDFSARFEQPTDLMTLTLTRSPLRHLTSAQLQASKLRRDSNPPTPDPAILPLPDLVKVALAELESIPQTSPVQQRSANPFTNPNPAPPPTTDDAVMSEPSSSNPIAPTTVVEAPVGGEEAGSATGLDALAAALAGQGAIPPPETPIARRPSDASSNHSGRSPGGIPKITLRLNKPPSVNGSPVSPSFPSSGPSTVVPAPVLPSSLPPILSASSSVEPSPALGIHDLPSSSSAAVVQEDGLVDASTSSAAYENANFPGRKREASPSKRTVGNEIRNLQAQSSVSTPSKLINGHATYPNHVPTAASQSSDSSATTTTASGATPAEEPISVEEMKQLRSIRALMKLKGEEKMLAFLQS